MSAKTQNERIIFGLKVKQLRRDKGLSFAELSEQSGMSVSYLNEIEKGKKFPKSEKLKALAAALNVDIEDLTAKELDKSLAPVSDLLQSNFLNELPLDLFGIDLAKVVDIIANAPARVGAFISTLLEISRSYALKEENFYFSALRSYLELHHNYFEDIENDVQRFCTLYSIPDERPLQSGLLRQLLEDRFKYKIDDDGLAAFPELNSLRAVFLPKEKKLLLNKKLNPVQQAFQFGKELGFQFLELKERANTSSLLRSRVFEEVLNHSKATYFSVALHIPRDPFIADMQAFFARKTWDNEVFLGIMQKYAATPEMFYHRLTNVLPRFFGMKKLFFLRFVHNPGKDQFEIDKELHLDSRHHPHGNALSEHYCRRWVALSLLNDLHAIQQDGVFVNTMVRAQRSTYIGTKDEYLCLTLARPAYPAPNRNVSVTLGLLVNDTLREKVAFLDDPAIQQRNVNNTCERCAVENCAERAVPPVVINRRNQLHQIEHRLKELTQ
jgi:transcriptional regulator with XRE-family HTH domain